jgi:hypothetical protein
MYSDKGVDRLGRQGVPVDLALLRLAWIRENQREERGEGEQTTHVWLHERREGTRDETASPM